MLKISKLADYATVIMNCLATQKNGRFSASAISEAVGMTPATVSKILKLLNDANLVTSTRGAQGGYHLSRSASQISLADIISAIDGQPAITECSTQDRYCQYDDHCAIRSNWQYINDIIYQVLDNLSLQDMSTSLSKSKSKSKSNSNSNAIPVRFYPLKKQEQRHV